MMENKKNVKLLIAAILGIIGVMRYKFLLAGMLFTSIFLAAGCDPADIEPMTINEDGSVTLTDAYVYIDTTPPPLPLPSRSRSIPVNPAGVSIKTAYTDSAGKKYVELTGKVPQWTNTNAEGVSANGIPEGLTQIIYGNPPQKYDTDYQRPQILTRLYNFPQYQGTDMPLENNIRLGSLYNNAKYTAVTISGLVESKPTGAMMKETGSTIRLFTEAWLNSQGQGNMPDYDRITFRWRQLTFGNYPNAFSIITNSDPIFRGSNGGGLNILIWDGASPKSTTLEFSYDGGRTWNKTVVDYSGVSYEEVPLTYMAWYKGSSPYYPDPNTAVIFNFDPPLAISPNPTSGTEDIYTFSGEIRNFKFTNSSIDNFLIPSFYPSNATNKQVYLTDTNGPTGNKISIISDANWTIEIADRIRVTCNKEGATDGTYNIFCDTYPPGGPSTPVQIMLTLKVTSDP